MKFYDPMTFEEVAQPNKHNICTKCGRKSLALYTHNSIGQISPSCFTCKVEGASQDIDN